MRQVSIIGVGETRMGRFPARTLRELIYEAGEAAIADAGIGRERIQAAYIGNYAGLSLCGQNHFGPLLSETLGLGQIPTVHTEAACASGSTALRMGYAGILSGLYDIVLVGGVEKMTHQPTSVLTEALAAAMDRELEAAAGLTFPGCFAMIATRYFHEYRNVKREMGLCAVMAHENATLNPDAQMPKHVTLEEVLAAPPVAAPLSLYDCSLVTDGAAFAVLAARDVAEDICRRSGRRRVDIVGSGHGGDVLTLYGKPCITSFPSTKRAAAEAYHQAGLSPRDIDFAEVHDCFTITEIVNIEDLGFFAPGKGGDAVAQGDISRDGSMPINVSGGLKAKGHPIGGTGISQIFEVVTQIRGEAGKRQLKRADIGLTHNLGGSAGTCLVHILRGE